MRWQDFYTRDEIMARIRTLAEDDKLTARQIAKAIGCNMTHNMVIGMVNRSKPRIVLGGVKQPKPRRRATGPKMAPPTQTDAATNMPRLKFIILAEVIADAEVPRPFHQDDLTRGDGRCRYPLWPSRMGTNQKPKNFELHYCGKPVVPGSSWCEDCRKIIYQAPAPKIAIGDGRKVDAAGRKVNWQFGT